jgi:hypothetical protein
MPNSEKKEVSSEEAQRIIKEERDQRVAKCRQELDAALSNNNCILEVSMLITQKGANPIVNLVPN